MNHRLNLGANIRRYRKYLGFSQEKLAHTSGLDRTYIGGVERGERNISLDNIVKIALALDVQPFQLLQIQSENQEEL